MFESSKRSWRGKRRSESESDRPAAVPFDAPFAPAAFQVEHAEDGTVDVQLVEATPADAAVWAETWQPSLAAHGRPSATWPWAEHIARAVTTPGWLCLAIRRGNNLDALMSLRLGRHESQLAPGADFVYIEYVGVAPIHQAPPLGRRLICGLGRTLVIVALAVSRTCGADGRVGLHSKPEVEAFYRRLGFEELGLDVTEDGTWRYFEMPPARAMLLLRRIGG